MNQEETLALYAQGKEAWNAWAREVLARRDDSQEWKDEARVDFTDYNFKAPVFTNRNLAPFLPVFLLLPQAKPEVRANFEETVAFVDFIGFIFPGEALFTGARFSIPAHFGEADFRGYATFDSAVFDDLVVFTGTFHDALVFNNAKFVGQSYFPGLRLKDDKGPLSDRPFIFNNAIFKQDVSFSGAIFPSSRVMFRKATFESEANFSEAIFDGSALFDNATFKGRTMFNNATFKSSVQFIEAIFEGSIHFDKISFLGGAYFSAVQSKSEFTTAGSEFMEVPNFQQATFVQAPRLDNVKIGPQLSHWGKVKEFFTKDALEKEGRWRALKRLAVQGHDHASEQLFFRGEFLARHGVADRFRRASFWVGVFYQLFSDFGRSLLLPLMWWAVGVLIFTLVYLGYHLSCGEWLSSECVAGTGNPWISALGLSVHKSLPAVSGFGFGDKIQQFHVCLYGVYSENPFRPEIPNTVAFLGVLQVLFSSVMIFLFLLAVRNHFRIK